MQKKRRHIFECFERSECFNDRLKNFLWLKQLNLNYVQCYAFSFDPLDL